MALSDPEFLAMRRGVKLLEHLTPGQCRRVLLFLEDRFCRIDVNVAAKAATWGNGGYATDEAPARAQQALQGLGR